MSGDSTFSGCSWRHCSSVISPSGSLGSWTPVIRSPTFALSSSRGISHSPAGRTCRSNTYGRHRRTSSRIPTPPIGTSSHRTRSCYQLLLVRFPCGTRYAPGSLRPRRLRSDREPGQRGGCGPGPPCPPIRDGHLGKGRRALAGSVARQVCRWGSSDIEPSVWRVRHVVRAQGSSSSRPRS
ncbi:MAG: hypothetical protein JWO10_413 [Microbacteriaceae bacterium]|nr:hypothetical protein [Microbacteriaceae bacterium]